LLNFYSHGTIGKIVFTYLGVLVALDVNSSSTRKEEPLMKSTQKNPFQKLRQLSLAGLTCLACLIWFALVCPPWRWRLTGRLLGRQSALMTGRHPMRYGLKTLVIFPNHTCPRSLWFKA
jgi:hypothetical protein